MSAGPPVDPRGPRFAAWVTTVVLAIVLVTAWWPLLAAQAVIFAIGGFIGLKYAPYSLLYRYLIAPRLGPTTEREDAAPLRFAQGMGFAFAAVGVLGYATGAAWLGITATALALAAAFAFCLGCETYLLIQRFRPPMKESALQ